MLKKKRNGIVVITIIGVVAIAMTMWTWSRVQETEKADDGQITIGYLTDSLVIERWQKDQEIFRSYATDKGANVIVYNANEDNDTQKQQIEWLIEKNVDVMVVIPYERDGLTEVIDKARREGIKVIAYDRLILDTDIDAYISFDNVKVGHIQAESILEEVPKGNYVIINGSPEDNNTYMFNQGYMEELKPAIRDGDVRIVSEIYADDWREEPAYNIVAKLIDEDVHIDAIIGANDRLSEAAIRALSEEGLAGEVYVAGSDADISACQRIVEGTQYVTVYKPIRSLAEQAVDLAMAMASNASYTYTETIYNGAVDVPYIKLDVEKVTKETMQETVIEDGFHREEDIYRK